MSKGGGVPWLYSGPVAEEICFFDFQYQGLRCRTDFVEGQPTNRKKLERVLAKIEKSIQNGTLEYRNFPIAA